MNPIAEALLSFLVVAGALFAFIGSLGLVRFRDFYTRLHGPTKATTLGVGCLLIASSIFFSITGEGLSLHEMLVTLFLFITAPISAHLLAKAALHQGLPFGSATALSGEAGQAIVGAGDTAPVVDPARLVGARVAK